VNELRFDGRAAIVTGAGRGVGRCHALLLASRGAKVVVADYGGALDGSGSSSEPAELVVKEIEAKGGEAIACFASVADEQGAAAIVQSALDAFGRVDVVVNNAGIAEPDRFEELTIPRFRKMVDVHYMGTVQVTYAAWPHMMQAGYGRIVNTFSEGALGITPKNTAYGGAKGGVWGFTRTLALESQRYGIRVNAVTPRANTRLAATPVLAHTYDLPEEVFVGGVMDSFRPELVSPVAAYLAHESCVFNGEALVGGAGQVMRIAVMQNDGFTSDELTPEHVAANVETLTDMSNAHEMKVETLLSEVEDRL
jgi:NAD(P)-dependent dehydrogenase (short-subunit alcohol dehydrogenase family)